MAPTPLPRGDEQYFHVLLTGFSQFAGLDPNPSWLAVQPLHNTIIDLSPPPAAQHTVDATGQQEQQGQKNERETKTKIQIQCIQVPVAWRAVLDVVPRIHGRTSAPSPYAEPWLDPKGEHDGSGGDGRSFPSGYSRITLPKVRNHDDDDNDNNGGNCCPWDFVLHVGTGRNGAVAIETLAHKDRYNPFSKDVRDEGPPPTAMSGIDSKGAEASSSDPEKRHSSSSSSSNSGGESFPMPSTVLEKGSGRAGHGASEQSLSSCRFSISSFLRYLLSFFIPTDIPHHAPQAYKGAGKVPYYNPGHPTPGSDCGFGIGYDHGRTEEHTLIDVPALVQHLQRKGGKEKEEFGPVKQNFDPGRYLCDFIYYASLAEARRGRRRRQGPDGQGKEHDDDDDEKKSSGLGETQKETPVLFIHCPDVGQPQPSHQVSALLKEVVKWVCQHHAA